LLVFKNTIHFDKKILIHSPFNKKTWAEYLNVSHPSLCRELKKLCNNNIIEINKDRISFLNEEALIEILQKYLILFDITIKKKTV